MSVFLGQTARTNAAQIWGFGGVVLLLGDAIFRLTPLALHTLSSELSLFDRAVLTGVIGFFALFEGHKGFAQSLSPRLGARLQLLRRKPHGLRFWLAPLFLMALIDATKKRLLINWMLTFGIVFFIVMVRHLPAPYRGIIDTGVVVGLSWGICSIFYFSARAIRQETLLADPETSSLSF